MKELTLSGKWKRIPFFISKNMLNTFFGNTQSEPNWYRVRSNDFLQPIVQAVVAPAWCRMVFEYQQDLFKSNTNSTPFALLELQIIQIGRIGNVKRLYEVCKSNIDNPLSFLDKSLNT